MPSKYHFCWWILPTIFCWSLSIKKLYTYQENLFSNITKRRKRKKQIWKKNHILSIYNITPWFSWERDCEQWSNCSHFGPNPMDKSLYVSSSTWLIILSTKFEVFFYTLLGIFLPIQTCFLQFCLFAFWIWNILDSFFFFFILQLPLWTILTFIYI